MILEVEHGDLVADGREDRVPVRAEHQVAGPVHRPVQVGELIRELHFLSETVQSLCVRISC